MKTVDIQKAAVWRHVLAWVAVLYTLALPHVARRSLEPEVAEQYWTFTIHVFLSIQAIPFAWAAYLRKRCALSFVIVGVVTSIVSVGAHGNLDLSSDAQAGVALVIGVGATTAAGFIALICSQVDRQV